MQTVVFPIKSLYLLHFSRCRRRNFISSTSSPRHLLEKRVPLLSTPVIGTRKVIDGFDCSFKCLSSPLCYSYNLAASRGPNGKLWCELLSSDKYSHPRYYSGNQSSHHFVAKVIMTENLLLHTNFFVPFMSKSQNRPIQIFTVHTSDATLLNLLYFELRWIISARISRH